MRSLAASRCFAVPVPESTSGAADSGTGLRWDAARERRMICFVQILQAVFVQLGLLARDPVHAPLSRHRIDR